MNTDNDMFSDGLTIRNLKENLLILGPRLSSNFVIVQFKYRSRFW